MNIARPKELRMIDQTNVKRMRNVANSNNGNRDRISIFGSLRETS